MLVLERIKDLPLASSLVPASDFTAGLFHDGGTTEVSVFGEKSVLKHVDQ